MLQMILIKYLLYLINLKMLYNKLLKELIYIIERILLLNLD